MGSQWRTVTIVALLCCAGCAGMAESSARGEVYWGAAKTCEGRYRTIHIDRVDSEGNVTAHSDADTRSELQAFTTCYHDEMSKVIDKGGAGLPAGLNKDPGVDLD
jgi:hypothetical protein